MRTSFSVEDANRTLPLVRRIVGDAVRDYWRWQKKVREFETVAIIHTIEGRPVLLCWQLGEDSVQYWHDEGSGFAGRQPLPSYQEI